MGFLLPMPGTEREGEGKRTAVALSKKGIEMRNDLIGAPKLRFNGAFFAPDYIVPEPS